MKRIIMYVLLGIMSTYSSGMEHNEVKHSDAGRAIFLQSVLKALAQPSKIEIQVDSETNFHKYTMCYDKQAYTFFRDHHAQNPPVTVLFNGAAHQFCVKEVQNAITSLSLQDNYFIMLVDSVFYNHLK